MSNELKKKGIQTVSDYLDTLTEKQRKAVEKLCSIVKKASSQLEEGLNYSTPAYRFNGKLIVGVAAAKTHIGFYVMSEPVMEQFKTELKGYDIAKTSIRIPFDADLPAALITKIVKARMDEEKLKPSAKKK